MRRGVTVGGMVRVWGAWVAIAAAAWGICMVLGLDVISGKLVVGWPRGSVAEIRLLRVAAAGVVGAALAGSGAVLQALLRNPLADPYVLGISSGSSVGVMAWLLATGPLAGAAWAKSGVGRELLTQGQALPALAGALGTCAVVYGLAWPRRGRGGGVEPVTLLLVGVVVAAINGALLVLLNALAPTGVRTNFFNYLMGAISNEVTWTGVAVAGGIVLVGLVPMVLAGRALNVGTLSDLEAASLGVRIGRLRTMAFVSASMMTAAAIMLAGPVGFVGLICPHVCRGLVGADHRKLLVAAPLCGAAFLMVTDTAVRLTAGVFQGELAVGVVTALLGGPFFLVLLKRGPVWRGGGA